MGNEIEYFWNIPPYIWKGIFSLLNVIGAGLILAIFATKYQKRKEIELEVRSELLKKQLDSYVKLNSILTEIQKIIAPPLRQQEYFIKIISPEIVRNCNIEYSSFFDSVERFDEYYKRLYDFRISDHIYMQYSVEQKLSELIGYMTELKLYIDAFCDTEHTDIFHLDPQNAVESITAAVQMIGICVQNDMNRFYGQIDQILAYEINHISLSYNTHYIKSLKEKILKFIVEHLEKYLENDNLMGRAAQWFYEHVFFRNSGYSNLVQCLPYILEQLFYIHLVQKKSISNPEELTDGELKKEFKQFQEVFFANKHQC